MACSSNNSGCDREKNCSGNSGYVCIIVLYILLAIIIGTAFIY